MDLENQHGWTVLPGSSKHFGSVYRLTCALEVRPTPSVSEEESVDELDLMEPDTTNKRKANASNHQVKQRPPKFPRISHEHAPTSQDEIANGFSSSAD
jgi:hypothetical protein